MSRMERKILAGGCEDSRNFRRKLYYCLSYWFHFREGTAAKPIIDLMPVVKELEAVDLHNKEFEALGYECKGEYGILGRRFFMKGGDLRTHHVHIFAEESRKEIERHLVVRDYLRTHKKDAEAYAARRQSWQRNLPMTMRDIAMEKIPL